MADGEEEGEEEGEGEGEKRLVDLRRSSLMASPQVKINMSSELHCTPGLAHRPHRQLAAHPHGQGRLPSHLDHPLKRTPIRGCQMRGTFTVENDRKRYRNAWAAAERAERFRPKEPSRPANGPFGRSLHWRAIRAILVIFSQKSPK